MPGAPQILAFSVHYSFEYERFEPLGRTCPHTDADRLQVSGTQLRNWLSAGQPVPAEFSRPEVLEILRAYYAALDARAADASSSR